MKYYVATKWNKLLNTCENISKPQKHYAKWKQTNVKAIFAMISFMWNSGKSM